jgi:molybdopterin molybdotransferase
MPRDPGDVRTRGFPKRVAYEDARDRIVDAVSPLAAAEEVAVRDALGRILAADVLAPRPLPAFDRAEMDGFAVQAARTKSATAPDPVVLEVEGECLPGAPFEGPLAAGRALRIMTGAPMPEGADAVVPAEFAKESRGFVRISGPVAAGKHVGRAGAELAEGEVALAEGRRLRPQDLGLLAAVGLERVRVAACPRVGVLTTGDEIVKPGGKLGPFQVFDVDTPLLAGLIERWGARPGPSSLQPDDPARVNRALGRLVASAGVDLVVTAGGSSVGSGDLVPAALEDLGKVLFHGVALRPGGPAGFGVVDRKPVFMLPGNPVACLAAFDLLVGPALRRLQGLPAIPPHARVRAPLTRRLDSAAGRTDYARVAVTERGLEPVATPGSSVLTTAVRADGYVVVPAAVEGWDAGEVVEAFLY